MLSTHEHASPPSASDSAHATQAGKPAVIGGGFHDLPTTVGIEEAARYLGIGRTTAYALAAEGELPVPVLRIGRSYRIPTAPLLGLPRTAAEDTPQSQADATHQNPVSLGALEQPEGESAVSAPHAANALCARGPRVRARCSSRER